MNIKTIGIIGNGHFGAFVRDALHTHAPQLEVRTYSSRQEPDNTTFFSLLDTAESDVVVFSVPIPVFEETLGRVVPLMRPEGIIMDVATVKKHTTEAIHRRAPEHPFIATHPMLGPQSYQKKGNSLKDLRLVITETNLSHVLANRFKDWFTEQGMRVVELTSDEHDKHLAETLFLTHLVGQTIHRVGFDRTAIDTVSSGFLMDAVESVKHDTALFADVAKFNPYCQEVLKRFGEGYREACGVIG